MEEAIVTLHVRKPTVYDDTVANNIGLRIEGFYILASPNGIGALRPNESILQTVSIQDISTAPFPLPFVHSVVSGAGLGSTDALPLEVAVVVSLRTNTATRAGRGRMYIPHICVSELQWVGGIPIFASASFLAAQAQDLLNDLAGTNSAPAVIASTRSMVNGVPQPAVARTVTSVKVDNLFDTQRRRAEGLVPTVTATLPITIP